MSRHHVFNQYYFDLLKRVKAWGKQNRPHSKAARDALRAIKEHYATYDLAAEEHLELFAERLAGLRAAYVESDSLEAWREADDALAFRGIPASTLVAAVPPRTLHHFLTTLFSLTFPLADDEVDAMLRVARDEAGAEAAPECIRPLWERLLASAAPEPDMPPELRDIESTSLGKLAREIMDEVDLSTLSSNISADGGDILKVLSQPDSGVAGLLTTVSQKMASKIASGELRQETLLSDAMKLASQLGGAAGGAGAGGLMDMGGMLSALQGLVGPGAGGPDGLSGLSSMFGAMGLGAGAGAGRGSGAARRSAVQKRMRRKLEQRRGGTGGRENAPAADEENNVDQL